MRRALLILLISLCLPLLAENAVSPEAMVREFYEKHPKELTGGLPQGEDLRWLSGYVSKRLLAKFEGALKYQQDWIRKNPDQPPYYLKPPFADGVHFTGVPDAVQSFEIVETLKPKEATSHVRLHFRVDDATPEWDVVVVVIEEGGRQVIDDVLFPPAE